MDEKWTITTTVDSLKNVMQINIGNNKIALFKLSDGSIHAIDGICSHEYALLADGEIDGEMVVCPEHGSRFNIRTGAVDGLPATESVKSYPVLIENGIIYVNYTS